MFHFTTMNRHWIAVAVLTLFCVFQCISASKETKSSEDDQMQLNSDHRKSKLEEELREQFDYFKGAPYVQQLDELHRKWRGKLGLPFRMNNPSVSVNARLDQDERSELASSSYADSAIKYQGDIILTRNQFDALLSAVDSGRAKRKVIKGDQVTWPSTTINYQLDSALDSPTQTAIRDAIKSWEQNTCMRFREGTATNYLNFFPGVGCYSTVGYVGGRQGVSIGLGCGTEGIVAHEIGHSLGFWHEQSRPDRDDFVRVNYDNILPGTDGNFQKNSVDISTDMGQPYDLGSIMHYGPKAFSEGSANTIDTLDPSYQNTIGQRKELSFIDIKQANLLYCASVCGNSVSCANAGYPDPNNCQQCKCPSGFGGRTCSEPAPSVGCSGSNTLTGSTTPQTLSSGSLSPNMDCSWLIKCPGGGKVNVRLSSVSFYCRQTCYDFVELKSEKFARTGSRFCCGAPSSTIVSAASTMAVIMETTADARSQFTGFTLQYYCTGGQAPAPTASTTRRPPSRRNEWGTWGSWGSCSATCGMCGTRARTRQCRSGNDCSGNVRDTQECGATVCPTKTTVTQKQECDTGFKSVECNVVDILRKQVTGMGGRLEEQRDPPTGGGRSGGSGSGGWSGNNRASDSHEGFHGRRKRDSGGNRRRPPIPYHNFGGGGGPGGPGPGGWNGRPRPNPGGGPGGPNGSANRRRPSKCRVKVYYDCVFGTEWIPTQEFVETPELIELMKDFRMKLWSMQHDPTQGSGGQGTPCCAGFQQYGSYCRAV